MGVASKLFSVGAKFLQKAAPKVAAAGEKLLPKVTAAGEKVMGKIPGIMSKAQEGIAKAWGKTGSFLASPATKSTIEGVGKGVAKGFGKVGSWMAAHPLGTAKLAATGFVGLEANKFLTNTTGKGLAEHVVDGAKTIDGIANGTPAQAGMPTGTQAGPAGLVNGIMSTVTNVFSTVSNVVGGLVGNKDMGGLLTALGVGAAGVFGLKRVGILAPLAVAGAGLFAANQAGLFQGAQQPGSPIASQTPSGLSKIAFAPYTGTGVQTGGVNPSMGVSGRPGIMGMAAQVMRDITTTRLQAESGLTVAERNRLAEARAQIAESDRRLEMTQMRLVSDTPEQKAAKAAKNERKAWEMAGVADKMPADYSSSLTMKEIGGTTASRSKSPFFGSNNPFAMSASGKSALDASKLMSGAGGVSGMAAAAASGLDSKSEKSAPSVTVEAEADDVPTKSADLGPTQLA